MAPLRDLALLVARLGVGIVFIAHGWQKFTEFTLSGTTAAFEQMGVPAPGLSAAFAAIVELVGGAMLVLGLLVPLAGLLLALDMAGAFFLVHLGNGIFVDAGGVELVTALGVASLLLAVLGAGRLSLDRLIAPRVPVLARQHATV